MFIENDYVVHKLYGVCKVNTITTLDILSSSKDRLYYTISPVFENESTVYVPVDNSKKLRKITTEDELLSILDNLDEIPTLWVTNEREREKSYKASLERGTVYAWLSIVKTIYNRKKQRYIKGKKLIGVDERYIKIAENLLFGEISVVLNIDKNSVKDYILKRTSETSFTEKSPKVLPQATTILRA